MLLSYTSDVVQLPGSLDHMATTNDDGYEPWRKQGFIVKPLQPGDRGDGQRFIDEFLEACGGKEADDDWMEGIPPRSSL